jgi:hypothetical protein
MIPPFGQGGEPLALVSQNYFPMHDEREFGAIKDGSWIEGNVTMISHKNRKMKKIE